MDIMKSSPISSASRATCVLSSEEPSRRGAVEERIQPPLAIGRKTPKSFPPVSDGRPNGGSLPAPGVVSVISQLPTDFPYESPTLLYRHAYQLARSRPKTCSWVHGQDTKTVSVVR